MTWPAPHNSRTLKVRGGIISQTNRCLEGFRSCQRIFPPQTIQVLLIGFEKGKLLNLRCTCYGRWLAHNRSLLRNERPVPLPAGLQSLRSANVTIQLPSFPFGCYTNPNIRPFVYSQPMCEWGRRAGAPFSHRLFTRARVGGEQTAQIPLMRVCGAHEVIKMRSLRTYLRARVVPPHTPNIDAWGIHRCMGL